MVMALIAGTSAALGNMDKPLFIGSWRLAEESCGPWPAVLSVTAADSAHIVADGKDYPATGLPGHPPQDRENQVITKDLDFVIFGDSKRDMILSLKNARRVTGQCHYRRE